MNTHISAILGNSQSLDGGAMFGNAPRTLWEKWVAPDSEHRIQLQCRAMLIQTQGVNILCEVGIGAFFDPKLAKRYGVVEEDHRLLSNLAKQGLSENDIDCVILSHLHFDHAGGLLPVFDSSDLKRKDLHFPRAQYIVGRVAWERACNPHPRDHASFIPGLTDQLKSTGRLKIIDGDFIPGLLEGQLSFIVSNGHTPGQLHTVIQGHQHKVMFAGDLIPGIPWVHLPVTMGYDRNAEMVIDEKKALYHRALEEEWYLFFTHDPKVAMATIKIGEKGKYEVGSLIEHALRFEI